MKPAVLVGHALVALATLTACDGGANQLPARPPRVQLPTAPSPPSSTTASGQITVRSIAPGSGATLTVRECASHLFDFKSLCAEPLQMTVDLEFTSPVPNAVVTASFYNGSQRCGVAYSGPVPLAAGSPTSFDLRLIELSDEYVQLHCQLPAETTRMVIQLWEATSPAAPLLTQAFAHTYTLANP